MGKILNNFRKLIIVSIMCMSGGSCKRLESVAGRKLMSRINVKIMIKIVDVV